MRFQTYVLAILVALALVSNIPNMGLAQGAPAGAGIPQLRGGVATVVAVDQPENCLRIRSGPGSSYDVIGCAAVGQQLNLTGVWASNDWAQLADNGWVYGPQIQTDLRPPGTAFSEPDAYVAMEEGYPAYDYGYLPDYGYSTYWYAGIPIIVYGANVWWRHHPWWGTIGPAVIRLGIRVEISRQMGESDRMSLPPRRRGVSPPVTLPTFHLAT